MYQWPEVGISYLTEKASTVGTCNTGLVSHPGEWGEGGVYQWSW